MSNEEIVRVIGEYGYVLPFHIYRDVCESPQVDHIKRNGDAVDIWTNDGCHWNIKTRCE